MILRLALVWLSLSSASWAATSTAWDLSGYSDFLKGRLSGLVLTADGSLKAGPGLRFTASLDQPALWNIASAPDGSIYAATGHRGKIFRVSPDGKFQLVWTATQSEIFAICVDAKGVLYAGTSPNGGVFRIENGRGAEVWHSTARYIWALQPAPDGTLYVATGDNGKVYRIDPRGNAEVYYETGQANVTALALGHGGNLYAGTEPNGLLYEISSPRQGTILYDSPLPEIRTIAVAPDGVIYAAAMGGSVASRAATPTAVTTATPGVVTATTPTVITVSEANETPVQQPPGDLKPGSSQSKGTASSTLLTGPAQAAAAQVIDVSGVDKSAIYRISPDRTVETLRTSKEDNVYDLFLDGDSLIFSTDGQGRIYRWADDKTSLLAEAGDGEVTRLIKRANGFDAAVSNPARLLSFNTESNGAGFYESPVHDSSTVARWGHLQWRSAGSGVLFRTRSGNAVRPDSTWSSWSEPLRDPSSALIRSPNARFLQWRAEWPAGATAELSMVEAGYLPQNTRPAIRSITVTSVLTANTNKTASAAANSSSPYSITVTDNGEPPPASTATSGGSTVSRQTTTQAQITWQADDADGDKLVYSVYFRGDDEHEWKLIRSRMPETTLLLDPDTLADGRYFFKVIASDAPSNAPEYARQTEFISAPILIDNTPPLITIGAPRRSGATLDIEVSAVDKTSSLRRCEFSLDAGSWTPLEAADGITDSPREQFALHLDKLRPGEHELVFRVYDSADNAGLARVVVR